MSITIFHTVLCPALLIPSNGAIEYDMDAVNGRYPAYTVAHFSCHYGYKMNGSRSRTCQNSETWNMHTPTCNQSNDNFYRLMPFLLISR